MSRITSKKQSTKELSHGSWLDLLQVALRKGPAHFLQLSECPVQQTSLLSAEKVGASLGGHSGKQVTARCNLPHLAQKLRCYQIMFFASGVYCFGANLLPGARFITRLLKFTTKWAMRGSEHCFQTSLVTTALSVGSSSCRIVVVVSATGEQLALAVALALIYLSISRLMR